MEKVRIGCIGTGGNTRAHLRRYSSIPEAEIVAFADPSKESLDRMAEEFPQFGALPQFDNHPDMLAQVEMDAVLISSPHTLHYQQGLDVLAAGKHLLLEKPMVCQTVRAKSLIQAAKEADRLLMISYQRHFQGPYLYIRDQLRSGALGEIQFVAALQSQNWLNLTVGKWRQKMSLSGGGQLNDSGSHLVDILLWTTGLRAEAVLGFTDNMGTEVDIDSATTIRFTNGAHGTLSIIGNSPMWWEEFSIWGTKGTLLYRNGTVLQGSFGQSEMTEVTQFPDDSTPDRNFVDAVLGRAEIQVPPECGLAVIELTEAIWRSAEEERIVKVSDLT